MVVVDGNGETEVAAIFLTSTEDRQSIEQHIEAFKMHNTKWAATKVIMSDKDMVERQVLKTQFPNAALMICLYHVLRTFNRELSMDKMGITKAQRNAALELAQKLCFAQNEDDFNRLCSSLDEQPGSVKTYFESNWLNITNEWVACFQHDYPTYGNRTNNRLESLNGKIKSVVSAYSPLHVFFADLKKLIRSLGTEKSHRAVNMIIKVPTQSESDLVASIRKHLTEYAFKCILSEVAKKGEDELVAEGGTYIVHAQNRDYHPTETICDCYFYQSMQLPCRHIMTVRERHGLNVFCETNIPDRWVKSFHLQHYR